ncbi:MAG: helix-turn-helix domain-containing protein [Actinomycetota bacterium]
MAVESSTPSPRDERVDAIVRAAIPVFAAHGYRRTSMALLADAAGVSRPALYQYFDDRADLFRAGFGLLLEEATDAALAALDEADGLEEQLDAYLQRLSGDGYASLSDTDFGAELMEARHEFASDVAAAALDRAHRGLELHLRRHTDADRRTRVDAYELLTLSPAGFKGDQPTPATYRRRLSSLARAAAKILAD